MPWWFECRTEVAATVAAGVVYCPVSVAPSAMYFATAVAAGVPWNSLLNFVIF